MTFAEVVAMLRRDGYMDAAILMEEQAVQILMGRQAMLENEALKKQLKVTMEDLADCKQCLNKATAQRNEAWGAICDHCQDFPCAEQACYWYNLQDEAEEK